MTPALAALLVAGLLMGFAVWALFRFQHRQIFKPARATGHLTPNPATRGVDYEDVFFAGADGLTLHGWYLPYAGATATMLFCHGNRGNLGDRVDSVVFYRQLGLNVFALDYRGYGLSEGHPTEEGLYRDAQAAWDYLCDQRGVDAARIVILGRSLGGGVASHLAANTRPGAVIIESTFTSIADMARERFPRLPLWRLGGIAFNNLDRIDAIRAPLLLVHSADDDVIGYHHGRALAAKVGPNARFVTIAGAHSGGHLSSGEAYARPLREFLAAAGIDLADAYGAEAQRSV